MIGQTVSHYRILDELGVGGMGVVYKAEDVRLERTVALKFLPPELTRDKDSKSRFVNEARAASALQHHNICTIHEIDETADGRLFISMDYYDGDTLKERIAKAPIAVDEAIRIAIQVAEGLAKAHEAGMVHRDIKPANVMITRDGVVKILDFGLAKLAGQTRITKTGTTVGTVAYMSPEQAMGRNIDHRSDIFALGAMLYEMLTGRVPFKGDHEAAVLYGIANSDPDELARYRQDLPEGLQGIVDTALRKQPDERYQCVSDMAADLSQLRHGTSPTGYTRGRRGARRGWVIGAAAFCTTVIIAGYLIRSHYPVSLFRETGDMRKMIVVLPFENLGRAQDGYFADGITEEITSRLASVQELGTIARTSAMQYRGAGKTIEQIGEELGVDYVLEGSVRWDTSNDGGNRVRITPRLIRVSNAAQMWSETYDRVIDHIFEVQSDIAEKVASQLDATLMVAESKRLTTPPTENVEAYTYYLRGKDYDNRGFEADNTRMAIEMFEKAIDLDSTFALAYAAVAVNHTDMYWHYHDRAEARLVMAKTAIDRALELDPDLPEAHHALGDYFYHGVLDYDRALAHYTIARQHKPSSDAYIGIASVLRRQGKMRDAAENYLEAARRDPRGHLPQYYLGETYVLLRDYAAAVQHFDLAISLSPGSWGPYYYKSRALVLWSGNTKMAMAVVRDAEEYVSRREEMAIWQAELEMLDRDYEKALDRLVTVSQRVQDWQFRFRPISLLYAELYDRMGNRDAARAHYDSACVFLEAAVRDQPDDARYRSALGLAYAGLGRGADAVREGREAVRMLPLSKDAWRGYWRVADLARIYAMVGERDAAIDQLEYLLSVPGELSGAMLGLDPTWDPLRDHERFESLVKRKEASNAGSS